MYTFRQSHSSLRLHDEPLVVAVISLVAAVQHLVCCCLFVHLLARARAAAIHSHIFPILKSDSLFAITNLNAKHLRRYATLGLYGFVQGNCRHVLGTPNPCCLSGNHLRQLELSFVKIFRNKLDFLLHVLFELLDANVFRD